MRIAIFGAGAVGSHLAVRLERAGHDVGVVARGATLAAIVANGLRLQVADETVASRPRATDDPARLGEQDVVFVTVKATSLASVAPMLPPLVGPRTAVVFAQNGMPWWYPIALPTTHGPVPALEVFALRDTLRFLDIDQVVPAVVYSANEVVAPGIVRNNSPQRNAIEVAASTPDPGPATRARVVAIREALEGASIASPPVDDIRAAVWLKLIANASASSIGIATGNPGSIALDPQIRQTFLRLNEELLSVAAALGFDLAGRLDVTRWTGRPQHHKSSLQQDYEARRPTELAEMLLAPLAFARTTDRPTPTLDAVAAIVRRLCIDRGVHHDAAVRSKGAPPA